MWIFSEQYGMFNADNISAIFAPDPVSDAEVIYANDSGHGFRVTEGKGNYRKIMDAILNGDSVVLVP